MDCCDVVALGAGRQPKTVGPDPDVPAVIGPHRTWRPDIEARGGKGHALK